MTLRQYTLALLVSAALPAAAFAQEQTTQVDDLVVTGTPVTLRLETPSTAGSRLDLTPLETPATVQILTGQEIRQRGDPTINAAVTRAVGVTTQSTSVNGGNNVAMRGFNADFVAFIYDGVRNVSGLGSVGFPFDPWTVERIEVLNGPASVLYGPGGVGGAINIVPRRPQAQAEHSFRASAGSFETYKLALDSTGPLGSDRLLYRVDISHQTSDDYIDRGDSESIAISGALTFVATDKLKFTLSHDWGELRPTVYYGLPLIYSGGPLENGVAREDLRKENYAFGDTDVYFDENSTRLLADWKPADNLTVKNITSFILGDRLYKRGTSNFNYQPATNNIIRSNVGIFGQTQRQWNNQTEVTWKQKIGGLSNTLSFGGDIEDLYLKRTGDTFAGTSVVSLFDPVPGGYPNVVPTSTKQAMDVTRYSLFVDDRLEVTDALSVVAGLRYDHAKLVRNDLVANSQARRTLSPVGWRIGAVFEPIKDLSFYGQVSKATDLVNNICCISAAQLAYEPAEGEQIEAGVKQVTLDGRLEWSLAAYRIRKEDLLVPNPLNPTQLIQVGAQSSKGIEATVAFRATETLSVSANGTVLDAEYDDFQELVSGTLTSRNGNTPVNVPTEAANVWVTWDLLPNLSLQGGVRYVGEQQINTANLAQLPSYTVVDASLSWEPVENLAVDFRIFNLLDRFYAPNFLGNGRGGGQWLLAPPRSFEVALTKRF